eukprot:1434430-Rhodomonas_salina.1
MRLGIAPDRPHHPQPGLVLGRHELALGPLGRDAPEQIVPRWQRRLDLDIMPLGLQDHGLRCLLRVWRALADRCGAEVEVHGALTHAEQRAGLRRERLRLLQVQEPAVQVRVGVFALELLAEVFDQRRHGLRAAGGREHGRRGLSALALLLEAVLLRDALVDQPVDEQRDVLGSVHQQVPHKDPAPAPDAHDLLAVRRKPRTRDLGRVSDEALAALFARA